MLRKLLTLVVFTAFLSTAAVVYADDVYVTKNGKKYHQEQCLLIKNKGAHKIALDEAQAKKLEPCQRCFKKDSDKQAKLNQKEKAKLEKKVD